MNIVVCIKQVPEVADAELEIDSSGTDIEREDLVLGVNEWDNYAVEQAVRLKEAHGGTVTAVTIGDEESEEVLRRALAMGADRAVRVDSEAFAGSDALGIARGLERVVRETPFDLVLTGAQSSDDGWAQVGVALAALLGVPHAALVVDVEVSGRTLLVRRELESNTQEQVALELPALLTVQTGINEPRYVSVLGIRKVRGVAIEQREADDLGLEGEVGEGSSSVSAIRLTPPAKGEQAEILTGSLAAICDRAAEIIRAGQGGAS